MEEQRQVEMWTNGISKDEQQPEGEGQANEMEQMKHKGTKMTMVPTKMRIRDVRPPIQYRSWSLGWASTAKGIRVKLPTPYTSTDIST